VTCIRLIFKGQCCVMSQRIEFTIATAVITRNRTGNWILWIVLRIFSLPIWPACITYSHVTYLVNCSVDTWFCFCVPLKHVIEQRGKGRGRQHPLHDGFYLFKGKCRRIRESQWQFSCLWQDLQSGLQFLFIKFFYPSFCDNLFEKPCK
jgi:hypothetical protein